MMEHQHPIPTPSDHEAIAQALGTTAQRIEDADLGAGMRYTVGEAAGISLDLYPLVGAVRLRQHDTEVALFRLNSPILAPNQVVFEREDEAGLCHFSVTAKGEVTLLLVPLAVAVPHLLDPPLADTGEGAYVESLAHLEPPPASDYGFDDAEYARLLSEGFGTAQPH
jgi:hypothetical protein